MAFLDETGLAEVWALANEKFGKIETGSYKGTGTYGSSNKNTLTFSFTPKIVFIYQTYDAEWDDSEYSAFGYGDPSGGFGWTNQVFYANGSGFNVGMNYKNTHYTLANNILSWYCEEDTDHQMNSSTCTYHYIAIG